MSYRSGSTSYGFSWSNLKCWLGVHCGWRDDIYVDSAEWFRYCPNCHKEKAPKGTADGGDTK